MRISSSARFPTKKKGSYCQVHQEKLLYQKLPSLSFGSDYYWLTQYNGGKRSSQYPKESGKTGPSLKLLMGALSGLLFRFGIYLVLDCGSFGNRSLHTRRRTKKLREGGRYLPWPVFFQKEWSTLLERVTFSCSFRFYPAPHYTIRKVLTSLFWNQRLRGVLRVWLRLDCWRSSCSYILFHSAAVTSKLGRTTTKPYTTVFCASVFHHFTLLASFDPDMYTIRRAPTSFPFRTSYVACPAANLQSHWALLTRSNRLDCVWQWIMFIDPPAHKHTSSSRMNVL